MTSSRFAVLAMLACGVLLCSHAARAEFGQQGPKLVVTGAAGPFPTWQGFGVAVSGDGNTVIVGGPNDNAHTGAAWVFTRSGGVWTQQGPKLVGAGSVGIPNQGASVAISGDGNTAIIGGSTDNNYIGAAWIFTRSGGVWTQQGSKLVGDGGVALPQFIVGQGESVSISRDGNTAVIGSHTDDSLAGAAWVFTRSGGVWTQQGLKLVGTGAAGKAQQGTVAISGDGNTIIVGGGTDNSSTGTGVEAGPGAAWVYIRNEGVWTQQGSKLVGTGGIGPGFLGRSVAISGDGDTAIIGGLFDGGGMGASWVFVRSGGMWAQQGPKLVGTGGLESEQGSSVAISGDGNTAIVGGRWDNGEIGATWIFTRSGDVWTQRGAKLVGTGGVGLQWQGFRVAVSSNGSTAVVGGIMDNAQIGATWIFARSRSLETIAVPTLGTSGLLGLCVALSVLGLFVVPGRYAV